MNHDLPFFYADGHSGLYCGKFAPWVSFTLRLSCICVIVVLLAGILWKMLLYNFLRIIADR